MDETLHDRIAERPAAPPEPGEATPVAASSGELITICGWCTEVNVLKVQRRHTDVLVIVVNKIRPKSVLVLKNGVPMQISHGICEPCRAKHFPETLKRKETQP